MGGLTGELRARRLRLAIASSLVSKCMGLAAQFMSLALVAHALGSSR